MIGAGRTTHFGLVPVESAKTMSGLQLLTAIVDGTLPATPIQQAMDFHAVQIARGFTHFIGVPKFEYYNPIGSVHGGYAACLLDSCMACAVHSPLEAGCSYATLVRPMTSETGEVRAEEK